MEGEVPEARFISHELALEYTAIAERHIANSDFIAEVVQIDLDEESAFAIQLGCSHCRYYFNDWRTDESGFLIWSSPEAAERVLRSTVLPTLGLLFLQRDSASHGTG